MNALSSLGSAIVRVENKQLSRQNRDICDKSVMDDLITDYMALGVKAAGTTYRLLNGTREVDTAL